MQFGRCFEEFEVGAVYKHWPGRTITEYDDTLFCMLTMNHHPLQAIANLEFEHVKHVGPTFHGDTIYAETTVLDKQLSRSKSDRGIVTVETIAYNQRGETVLSFKRRVMVPTRAYDEAQQRAWEEKMARARKEGETER